MNLREYQAKRIFADYGIEIPQGRIATSPEEAAEIARDLGVAVVLKPQLGVKGRAKVGGIAFADDAARARSEAERLFAMTIKGERVHTLLVEEKLSIAEECYVAITIDYNARQPVLMASREGGINIEDAKSIVRIPVNILDGPSDADFVRIANELGAGVAEHLKTLYRVFREVDAELVEINPLIRCENGNYVAADAVLNINADSVFRHETVAKLKAEIPVVDAIAEEAAQANWTYIALDGEIGVLSSGAGLTMTILDLLKGGGASAANFLDTAQIDEEGMVLAFDLLARAGQYKVLFLNIFAGLNRCDQLAEGIRRYVSKHPLGSPLVVRMIGNQEEEGHRILHEIGIETYSDLEEAVAAAIRISKARQA